MGNYFHEIYTHTTTHLTSKKTWELQNLVVLSVLAVSITANPVMKRCSQNKAKNEDMVAASKEGSSSRPLSERADYLIEDIQLNPLTALNRETEEDDYSDYISDIFDMKQGKMELTEEELKDMEEMSKEKDSIVYFKDC